MPTADSALRQVTAHMKWRATDTADYAVAVRPAISPNAIDEELSITVDGRPVEVSALLDAHDTRLDVFVEGPGIFELDYRATVASVPVPPLGALEPLHYLRPSRYCEADAVVTDARARFGRLRGAERIAQEVTEWVHQRFTYTPGSGSGEDGAVAALRRDQAVCRDYAHVLIAYLRALDVPARKLSVYAPGLDPMDFHAVAEALIDGRWYVFDPTRLAPRRSMVRIATGRDGADTAFLTNVLSDIELLELRVDARMNDLPPDDPDELVELG